MSRKLKDIYARPVRGRLTPEELSKAMKGLGLTDASLAELYGTRAAKVAAWRHGEEDIPFPLAMLLAAWTEPGAMTKSRAAAQLLAERAAEEAKQEAEAQG